MSGAAPAPYPDTYYKVPRSRDLKLCAHKARYPYDRADLCRTCVNSESLYGTWTQQLERLLTTRSSACSDLLMWMVSHCWALLDAFDMLSLPEAHHPHQPYPHHQHQPNPQRPRISRNVGACQSLSSFRHSGMVAVGGPTWQVWGR